MSIIEGVKRLRYDLMADLDPLVLQLSVAGRHGEGSATRRKFVEGRGEGND
jgi:hypothetical protein